MNAHRENDAKPQWRSILVVVDPNAGTHACIDKAARIAGACGSSLELFICDAPQVTPDRESAGAGRRESSEVRREGLLSRLEQLAEPLRARGLEVTVACEWHASLEYGIAHHVIHSQPDLVVKEISHRRLRARASVTLTDRILIRLIAPPLLLVRGDAWPERVRITVGTDPCHPVDRPVSLDRSMLAIGGILETALHGELEVLHVFRPPFPPVGESVTADDTQRTRAAARRAVEQLVEDRTDCGAPLLVNFVDGRVASSIVEFTRRHERDLLVLGAAARPQGLRTSARGIAAQLLEDPVADLLIVKPPGFASPLLTREQGVRAAGGARRQSTA
jgi:K+-sensing histidine kinase KdpD